MPILSVYIGPETEKYLKSVSEETGRSIEELAECAVSEYCLNLYSRSSYYNSLDEGKS